MARRQSINASHALARAQARMIFDLQAQDVDAKEEVRRAESILELQRLEAQRARIESNCLSDWANGEFK